MKNLYKYSLLLLIANLCLLGCSESDNGSDDATDEFYFRFKIDGEQVAYIYTPDTQTNLTGIIDHDEQSGVHAVNIGGIDTIFETGLTNRFSILIGDMENIVAGVSYTNIEGKGDRTPDSAFNMSYFDAEGNIYIAVLNTTATQLYDLATVQFTEITNSHISGSFSGTLKWYDVSGGTVELVDSVIISEGIFKVSRY